MSIASNDFLNLSNVMETAAQATCSYGVVYQQCYKLSL